MTRVFASNHGADSPKDAMAQEIALALMGVGALPKHLLAEAATWQRPDRAVTGRAEILAAVETGLDRVEVEQVETHGKAGSVSGRLVRGGEARLFCHVIRFTTANAKQIAQLVSFEHAG